MELLRIKELSKSYHSDNGEFLAIENFDISINKGEFIAVVGPSGCGKSTLLSILAGLEEKNKGEIIKHNGLLKTGYMLQNDTLFPWLTIKDNCLLGLKISNNLTNSNVNYVLSLINTYGLKKFINSYPNELSGGMRQRVALIRTLAINPELLLLDEPFSALDYQTRIAVSNDVFNIIRKEKKTTIMVTHDLAEAVSMADRVIVMSKNPSKIKKIYEIKMENKGTPFENRSNKEFITYYNKIWKDLDFHV